MYKNRIKELRIDNDFKQKKMAEILSVTQAQYSRIENLEYQLSYDGLIKLAEFYNTSIDYILGLTDVSKSYPRSKAMWLELSPKSLLAG